MNIREHNPCTSRRNVQLHHPSKFCGLAISFQSFLELSWWTFDRHWQSFDLPRHSETIVDMVLPVVKTLSECSDFSATVLPYVSQLNDLPQQLIQSWNNPTELLNIYLATNPLISAFAFSLFLAPLFLVISEINKNYSQVDRCWSILPTLYNAHFVTYAHLSGLPTQRLDNLIAFSTIWSVWSPDWDP